MFVVRTGALFVFLATPLCSQTFESATIQLSPANDNSVMTGGFIRGGRYELRHASMLDLISTAWGISAERVIGGPDWLEKDRFGIVAKTAPDASPDQMPAMLQTLLKDRFHLKTHDDSRPVPVLVLTTAKRTRLKASDGSLPDGCRQKQNSMVLNGTVQKAIFTCGNITMADFAAKIPSIGGSYISHSVVDRTGLTDAWDFTIEWTARQLLQIAGSDGITFEEALEKQLGLTLTEQKVPMSVVVIDEVVRVPEGAVQTTPSQPMEFEAVDIKPSEPGTQERALFPPGGRIDFRAVTLKDLVRYAWDIHSDNQLSGLPGNIGEQRFNVLAKAPADTERAGSANGPPMDLEALRIMMRAMLADRFHLKAHDEEQSIPVDALTAAKPKLIHADPESRSGCKQSLGDAGNAAARVSTFSYSCKSTTMAQLAETLQKGSMADLTHPVVDATGLDGAWDFTLSWTPRVLAKKNDKEVADAAPDPDLGLTLEDALEKQLGLKLELQKRPARVLIIDHIDPKPTDN